MVKVAVDAMGGDFAPAEIIKGVVRAATDDGVEIILVGPITTLEAELAKYNINQLPIHCVEADEVIREGESPAFAIRRKPNASIPVAMKLVKNGQADAVYSAGPTGAVVSAALQILGPLEGVERPAAGGTITGFAPNTIVVDAGGNVDCKPHHLLNFAVIGAVQAKKLLGIADPTVALLSVGAEEGKGNELVKEAFPLFKKSGLNFIGNVEGYDIPIGRANVIICDGFVGNVLVKFGENLGRMIAEWLKVNLKEDVSEARLEEVSNQLIALTNPIDVFGGGPLWGVDGVVIIAHGRSQAVHVSRAIAEAKKAVENQVVEALKSELSRVHQGVEQ
jgi:glycerol-3-phosphate acyltransferase PlsX